jgi:hypothetical protein
MMIGKHVPASKALKGAGYLLKEGSSTRTQFNFGSQTTFLFITNKPHQGRLWNVMPTLKVKQAYAMDKSWMMENLERTYLDALMAMVLIVVIASKTRNIT